MDTPVEGSISSSMMMVLNTPLSMGGDLATTSLLLLPDDYNSSSPLEAEYRTLAVAITSTYTTPKDAESATEQFIEKLYTLVTSSSSFVFRYGTVSFLLSSSSSTSTSPSPSSSSSSLSRSPLSFFTSSLVPTLDISPTDPTDNHSTTVLASLTQPIVVLDTLVRLVLHYLTLITHSSVKKNSTDNNDNNNYNSPFVYKPINSNNIIDTCTVASFLMNTDQRNGSSSPSRTNSNNHSTSEKKPVDNLTTTTTTATTTTGRTMKKNTGDQNILLLKTFDSLITILCRLSYNEHNQIRLLRRGLYTVYYLIYKALYDQYIVTYMDSFDTLHHHRTEVEEEGSNDDHEQPSLPVLEIILHTLDTINQSFTYWNNVPTSPSVLETLLSTTVERTSSTMNPANDNNYSPSTVSTDSLFHRYQTFTMGIFHLTNTPVSLFYDMYYSIHQLRKKYCSTDNENKQKKSSLLSSLLVTNLYSFASLVNTSINVHSYHTLSCFHRPSINYDDNNNNNNEVYSNYLPGTVIEKCITNPSTTPSNGPLKSLFSLSATVAMVSSLSPVKRPLSSSLSRNTNDTPSVTSPVPLSTPSVLFSPTSSSKTASTNRTKVSILSSKGMQYCSKILQYLQSIVTNYIAIESTNSNKIVPYTLSLFQNYNVSPTVSINNNKDDKEGIRNHIRAFHGYLRSLSTLRETVQDHIKFHQRTMDTLHHNSTVDNNDSLTIFFIDTPLKLSTIIKDIGSLLNTEILEITDKYHHYRNFIDQCLTADTNEPYSFFLLRTIAIYLLNNQGISKSSLQALFFTNFVDKEKPSILSYFLSLLTDTTKPLPLALVKNILIVLFALTTNRVENLTVLLYSKPLMWSQLGDSIGNCIVLSENITDYSEINELFALFTYMSFGTEYPTYEWFGIFLHILRSLCKHHQQTNTMLHENTWRSMYTQLYAFARYLSLSNHLPHNEDNSSLWLVSSSHRLLTVSTRVPLINYTVMELFFHVISLAHNERYNQYNSTDYNVENVLLYIFRLLLPCSWSVNHTNALVHLLKQTVTRSKASVSQSKVLTMGWKLFEILGEYGYLQSQISFPLSFLPSLTETTKSIIPYIHRSLQSRKGLPIYTGRCPDISWYFSPHVPSSLTVYSKTVDNECVRGIPVWPSAHSTSTITKGYTLALWLMILPNLSGTGNVSSSVTVLSISDSDRSLTINLLPCTSSSTIKTTLPDSVASEYTVQIKFTYQKHSSMIITAVNKLSTYQWYNIVIDHQAPTVTTNTRLMKGLAKLGLSMAEVDGTPCALYINGMEDTNMLVRYPNFGKNVSSLNPKDTMTSSSSLSLYTIDVVLGMKSSNIFTGNDDTSTIQSKAVPSVSIFTGCVASFQLWDTPLSVSQVQGIYHLGPSYRGLFEPLNVSRQAINQVLQHGNRHFRNKETQKDAQMAIETLLQNKLNNHLLFCIYPSNTGGCILPTGTSKRTLKPYFISTAPIFFLRSLLLPSTDNDTGNESSTVSNNGSMINGIGLMSNVSVPCIVDLPLIDMLQQTISIDTLLTLIHKSFPTDDSNVSAAVSSALVPLFQINLPLHCKDPLYSILMDNNEYLKEVLYRSSNLPSSSMFCSAILSTVVTKRIALDIPLRFLCWILDWPYTTNLFSSLPPSKSLANVSLWLEENIFTIMRYMYPTVPFPSPHSSDLYKQYVRLFNNSYPAQPKLSVLHTDVVRNLFLNYTVWLRPGVADESVTHMVLVLFLYCTIHQECLQLVRDSIGLPHLFQLVSVTVKVCSSSLVIDLLFALVRFIVSSSITFALPNVSFRNHDNAVENSGVQLPNSMKMSPSSTAIALSKREVWSIFHLYAKESAMHFSLSPERTGASILSTYLLESILTLLQQIVDESKVASIAIVYCMLPDAYGEYVRTVETVTVDETTKTTSVTTDTSLPSYGGAEILLASTLSSDANISTLATNLLNQWMAIASQENITLFTDTSGTSVVVKKETNETEDDQKHLHAFLQHAAEVANREYEQAAVAVALETETNETILLEQHLTVLNEVYGTLKTEHEKLNTLTYDEGKYYSPPKIDKESIQRLHSQPSNGKDNNTNDSETLVCVPPSTFIPLRAIQHILCLNSYGYGSDVRTILPQRINIYPADALSAWNELRIRFIAHGAMEALIPHQPPRHWLSSYWMLLGTAQRQNLLPHRAYTFDNERTGKLDNGNLNTAVENLSTKLNHLSTNEDNEEGSRDDDQTPVKDAPSMMRQLFSPADAKLLLTVSTVPKDNRTLENDDYPGGITSEDSTTERFMTLSSTDQSMDISILTDGASLESHSVNTTIDDTSLYGKEISTGSIPLNSLSTPVKNETVSFSPSNYGQRTHTSSADDTEPVRKFSLNVSPTFSRMGGTVSPLAENSLSGGRDSLGSSLLLSNNGSSSSSNVSTTVLLSLPCKCIMPFQAQAGTLLIYRDRLSFVPLVPELTDSDANTPNSLPFSPTLYTPRVSAADNARKEYLRHLLPPITPWIIPVDTLVSIELRRHQHQPVALEFFATVTSSVMATDLVPDASSLSSIILGFGSTMAKFLSFESIDDKDLCIRTIQRLRPPYLSPILRRPRVAAREIAHRWRLRKVSNFDFLITINRIAGRTFNDIAQYPIFPWILSDYSSETLDLQNPQSYRDFAYPIAAQTNERRKGLRIKYEFLVEQYMEEQNIDAMNPITPQTKEAILSPSSALISDQTIFFGPPFHFGSCIMKGATVAWYLMRNEPFTTYHLLCGDGRYDKPDRLFHSIGDAYRSATSSDADIKELIPQFFTDGSFLRNHGHAILGWRQDYLPIDDVVLPPWAKDTNDFIRIHRLALESEYVSNHLHLWIDLVFGHKQRPESPSAEVAVNTFHRLMYPGYVDISKIKAADENLYKRVCLFLDEFGVLPPILFPYSEIRTVNRTNRGYQVVNNYQRQTLRSGLRSGSFAGMNDHPSAPSLASQRSISIVSRSTGSRGSGTLEEDSTTNTLSSVTDLTVHTKKLSTNSIETELDHPGFDINPSNQPRYPLPIILETLTVWPLFSRSTPHCSLCVAWSGVSTCMDHQGGKVYSLLAWPQIRQGFSNVPNSNDEDNHSTNENVSSNVGSYHMRSIPNKGAHSSLDNTSVQRLKKERSSILTTREGSAVGLSLDTSSTDNPTLRSALVPLHIHSGAIILLHPIPGTDSVLTMDTGRESGFHQWESLVPNKLLYMNGNNSSGNIQDIPHFRWRLELDTRLSTANDTVRKVTETIHLSTGKKIAITGSSSSSNTQSVRNSTYPSFQNNGGLDTIGLIYRNPNMLTLAVNPFLTPVYRYTSGTEYWSQAPLSIWSTSIMACSSTAPLLISIGYSDNSLRLYAYGDLPVNMLINRGKLDRCTVPLSIIDRTVVVGGGGGGSSSSSLAPSVTNNNDSSAVIQWKDTTLSKGNMNNYTNYSKPVSNVVPLNASNRRLQLLTVYGHIHSVIPTAVTCIDRMHPAVAARSVGLFSSNNESITNSLSAIPGLSNTVIQSSLSSSMAASSVSTTATASINGSAVNPSSSSVTNTLASNEHYPSTVPLLSPVFAVGYVNGTISFYGLDVPSSGSSSSAPMVQLQTSTVLRTIPDAHRTAITCLYAQPALDTLLSASMDGTIGVWSLTTGVLKLRIHPTVHNESIGWLTGTVFHPVIITYLPQSNSIMHFSLLSGHALSRQPLLLSPYSLSSVYCYCLSDDGNTLLLGGTGPHILIVNTYSLMVRGRIGLNGTKLYEPSSIFTRKSKDTIDEENSTNGPNLHSSVKLEPFTSAVTSLKLTPHENSLWVGCASGEVRIFVGGW